MANFCGRPLWMAPYHTSTGQYIGVATFFFFFFFFFFCIRVKIGDEKSIENGLEGQKFLVVCLFWGGCHHPNYLHLQDSVPKSAFIEERLRRIKAEKRAESKVDLDTKGILLRNFVQFYVVFIYLKPRLGRLNFRHWLSPVTTLESNSKCRRLAI